MALLTWLPDTLRAAGLDVYVLPGAETRTTWASGLTVNGIVWHHTATSTAWLDGHVAALLRDGRRDLAGPLSQIGIERDGTIVIVALGRASHNGYGEWGNDSIGLEFYNDGRGEPLTEPQYDAGTRATAAILQRIGLLTAHVKAHRETDPRRKIDPLLNMNVVRADIYDLLYRPPAPVPPNDEDEDMSKIVWFKAPDNTAHAYNVAGVVGKHLGPSAYNVAKFLGTPEANTIASALPSTAIGTVALLDGPLKNVT